MAERVPLDDLRDWHEGWRRNRGLELLSSDEAALLARVGAPGRSVEHLVLGADDVPRRIDTAAAAAVAVPDAWVTVPTLDPGRVADRLREHRLAIRSDSEQLMSIALADQGTVVVPRRYLASVDVSSYDGCPVVRVRVHDPDEQIAAAGDAAVVGDLLVPDRVETDRRHRRQGLGAAVMTMLAGASREVGAARGLLVASPEGQRLYTSLGWTGHERVVIGVNA